MGTDVGLYHLLSLHLHHNVAKSLSYITGGIVAYFINKLWTFEARHRSTPAELFRFWLVYGFGFGLNVLLNHTLLWLLPAIDAPLPHLHKLTAVLVATGTSAVSNFLGMKFLVFKQKQDHVAAR